LSGTYYFVLVLSLVGFNFVELSCRLNNA